MKKINERGFTLIELLAVITIMGILMMVAIPAVSRTIENSRRDSFASVAKEYVKAVRTAILADNIVCGDDNVVVSAMPDGVYYFVVNTTETQTQDLMESGGKSPFGGAEIRGYVKWTKTTNDKGEPRINYVIKIGDSGTHGFKDETTEGQLKRSSVVVKDAYYPAGTEADPNAPEDEGAVKCTYSS